MEENKINEELNNEVEIIDLESSEEGISTGTVVLTVAVIGLALLGVKTGWGYCKKGGKWIMNKFSKKEIDNNFEDDFYQFRNIHLSYMNEHP